MEEANYELTNFILSSQIRLNLLLSLFKTDKPLKELESELYKTSGNLVRGLNELKEKNLVEKSKKKYKLSSTGYLITLNIINLLDNWAGINKTQKFWDEHLTDNLPLEFIKKIHIWKNAKLIRSNNVDFLKPLDTYMEYIRKSNNIKIIMPFFSKLHFDVFIKTVKKNNAFLELITTKSIIDSLNKTHLSDSFFKLVKEGKIKINITDVKLDTFYTYADNFAALYLFFNEKYYDDSSMLLLNDEKSAKSAKDLFDYCKNILLNF